MIDIIIAADKTKVTRGVAQLSPLRSNSDTFSMVKLESLASSKVINAFAWYELSK